MITNVGLAHLEGFGGVEGVKKGKQELYVHLRAGAARPWFRPMTPFSWRSALDGLQRRLYRTADHPPLLWRDGDAPDAPLFWSTDGSRHTWTVACRMGSRLPVQLEGPHQVSPTWPRRSPQAFTSV